VEEKIKIIVFCKKNNKSTFKQNDRIRVNKESHPIGMVRASEKGSLFCVFSGMGGASVRRVIVCPDEHVLWLGGGIGQQISIVILIRFLISERKL